MVDGKYGVAKAVSIIKIGNKKNDTEVTLKKGKTAQITAIEIKKDKKIKHHRNLCYESSNTKVVTVTSDGVIKAMRKGNCKIWVYAQNGVYKVIMHIGVRLHEIPIYSNTLQKIVK